VFIIEFIFPHDKNNTPMFWGKDNWHTGNINNAAEYTPQTVGATIEKLLLLYHDVQFLIRKR
jgi:hypothetical protein